MKRQRVKFLWDLYWENKTCKPKRSIASTSACIWIRHLISKCNLTNFYNKAAERVNLLRHPFSIVTFRPQRIYQLMIRPISTYCGYKRSESRKRMIHSIGKRSLEIISAKFSPQNCDLRFLIIDNFLQKRAYCFVFDCLNGTVCFPSKMNYFPRSHHTALKTMVKQQNC